MNKAVMLPIPSRSVSMRFSLCRLLTIAVVVASSATDWFANWWLVRSSDGKCLVVDIEPVVKNQNVTKIGKDVYQSADQAETDAKQLCKDVNAPNQSAPNREQ